MSNVEQLSLQDDDSDTIEERRIKRAMKENRINAFRARVSIPTMSKVLHVGYFLTLDEAKKAQEDIENKVRRYLDESDEHKNENIESIYKRFAREMYPARKRGRKTIEGKTQHGRIKEIDFKHKEELDNYKPPKEAYVTTSVRAGRKLFNVGRFATREIAKEAKRMLINRAEKEIQEKFKEPTDKEVYDTYVRICREMYPRKRQLKSADQAKSE